MSIANVIKAHWQGFVGGPDFKRNIQHRFILENKLQNSQHPSTLNYKILILL